jgi:hypothetical protein
MNGGVMVELVEVHIQFREFTQLYLCKEVHGGGQYVTQRSNHNDSIPEKHHKHFLRI